ncbi:MAG: hypothetical protein JNL96_22835 [Planctomycetaceae bacterium]|nr:hypothetical protein [Planctomycetaceae bacterium]
MNLFGKILVALNLVMSLVFMSFAVAVYSTHQNWRDVVQRPKDQASEPTKPVGLVYQVEDLMLKNDQLVKKIESLRAEIAQEARLKNVRLALLETQKVELEKQIAAKAQEIQAITADKQMTSANIEKLTVEVGKKSADIEKLTLEVANKNDEIQRKHEDVVRLTNQLSQLGTELAKLQNQVKVLVAKQTPATQTSGAVADAAAPKLEGIVRAATNDLVEISLGSDDGVARGQTMYVYRPGATAAATKLIGRIEILQTTADVSVGRILEDYRKGIIEKDDRVATRFN